jgi:hypothetical protein
MSIAPVSGSDSRIMQQTGEPGQVDQRLRARSAQKTGEVARILGASIRRHQSSYPAGGEEDQGDSGLGGRVTVGDSSSSRSRSSSQASEEVGEGGGSKSPVGNDKARYLRPKFGFKALEKRFDELEKVTDQASDDYQKLRAALVSDLSTLKNFLEQEQEGLDGASSKASYKVTIKEGKAVWSSDEMPTPVAVCAVLAGDKTVGFLIRMIASFGDSEAARGAKEIDRQLKDGAKALSIANTLKGILELVQKGQKLDAAIKALKKEKSEEKEWDLTIKIVEMLAKLLITIKNVLNSIELFIKNGVLYVKDNVKSGLGIAGSVVEIVGGVVQIAEGAITIEEKRVRKVKFYTEEAKVLTGYNMALGVVSVIAGIFSLIVCVLALTVSPLIVAGIMGVVALANLVGGFLTLNKRAVEADKTVSIANKEIDKLEKMLQKLSSPSSSSS